MIQLLKKYKAFIFGFIVIVPIFYLLDYIGFIVHPKEITYEVVIYAIFWGLMIALPIHHYKYLKKKKKTVFKVLGIFLLFIITVIIDSKMSMPDNPLTFILLIGFWFGLTHLLLPQFIKKYWKVIGAIYIPLLLYFVYLRLFSGGLENYLKAKEEFPFFITFFLPIPIFIFLWIFEQWKSVQNLKAEKSKAELSLLRNQINPHFFFNTLNNLYALTIKNSKQAPEVILKLSDMMRYTIYEGEKEKVRLLDEIEYLKNYIQLHKIRYKKSVTINFNHDVDTELTIAPLLYIVLLENAFKHGIETLSENAFININLYDDNNYIHFIIENNFDSNEINEFNGIGLKNLKRRLSLLYKDNYKFEVDTTNNSYKVTLKISKDA